MAVTGEPQLVTSAQVRDAYLGALMEGDVRRARTVAQTALREGMTMSRLYVDVFQAALYEVGRLWQSGQATVAQEHLATATTDALMARLSAQTVRALDFELRAVTTATENDFHALGSRFLADFLEADGWTVIELGGATPTADLVALVRDLEPALVCLSTTLPANLPEARAAVSALRSLAPRPLIAIGGQAYRGDEKLAASLGADLFAHDAEAFLHGLHERLTDAGAGTCGLGGRAPGAPWSRPWASTPPSAQVPWPLPRSTTKA